jgi:hypothetical protein
MSRPARAAVKSGGPWSITLIANDSHSGEAMTCAPRGMSPRDRDL